MPESKASSSSPLLSIVVVNWNTRDVIRACLSSLKREGKDVAIEVIVVDNASLDDSVAMLRRDFRWIRLIANRKNLGYGAANNQGIRVAKGKYVLVLNPDTFVPTGQLARAISFADLHPSAAVVGCRTLNADGTLQRNCFLPPSLINLAITSLGFHHLSTVIPFFGRERMSRWDYETARLVDVVAGCFMLLRTEAIKHVGMFDERFFVYAEETDWCVRFWLAGWQVWYTPDATITHYGGVSTGMVPSEMQLEGHKSLVSFLEKYHGQFYVLLCRVLLLQGVALRAFYRAIVSVLKSEWQPALRALTEGVSAARLFLGLMPSPRGERTRY